MIRLLAWMLLVLAVSTAWIARAQQRGGEPARGGQGAPVPVEAPNFVGKTAVLDASNISAGRRHFEAGARSNWHSHPNGQLILVETGVGLHQIEGKPIERLSAGASAYVGPGIVHWHGAAPDAGMTQVNIGFGGPAKWGEPVPDAVYRKR